MKFTIGNSGDAVHGLRVVASREIDAPAVLH